MDFCARTAITLMWDPPTDTGGDQSSMFQTSTRRSFHFCPSKAMVDFYRVQADDGLGGAFGDVAVVAGTYTTIEHLESKGRAVFMCLAGVLECGIVSSCCSCMAVDVRYLTPGRPYRFRVAAETVVGTGPYTAVFQQVGEHTSCGKRTCLGFASISWAAGGGSSAVKSPNSHCRIPGKPPVSLDSAGLPGVAEVETIAGYTDDAFALGVLDP